MDRFDIENFLFEQMGCKGSKHELYLEMLPDCSYSEFLDALDEVIEEGRVTLQNGYFSISY